MGHHPWKLRFLSIGLALGVCAFLTVRAAAPDLIITDIWVSSGQVYYQVRNVGDGPAPAGHLTGLNVDGAAAASDTVPAVLAPGSRLTRHFTQYSWNCSWPVDTVRVTADVLNAVAEVSETNNFRSENWKCDNLPPVITAGPTVSDITKTSARIQWSTDEDSTGTAYYGRRAKVYDGQSSHAGAAKDHDVTLSGLTAGAPYHFAVESADSSGNKVASAEGYFVTLPNSGADLSTEILADAARKAPPEFTAEAKDNEGVDRIEFYVEGTLVETDYSAPFQCTVDPVDLGMTPLQFYQALDIQAVARDAAGAFSLGSMTFLVERPDCFPAELDFDSPRDDYEIILTSGSTVPPGEMIRVSVEASESPWEERETRWGTWVSGENVALIEVFLDDAPTPFLTASETTSLSEDWDAGGLAEGVHHVKARVWSHDCGMPLTETHHLRVTPYEERLLVERRDILPDASGNVLTVRLRIRNMYLHPITLDGLHDDVTGFMPIPETRDDCDVEPDYRWATKSAYVYLDFHPGVTVAFGATYDLEYRVVPVLYPGFDDYAVGTDPATVVFYPSGGSITSVTAEMGRSGAGLRDLVLDAAATADYLLVTNPKALCALYDSDDVGRLLGKMAELAAARQGVLGFCQTFGVVPSSVGAQDQLAVGDVLLEDDHAGGEFVVVDVEAAQIKIYGGTGSLRNFDIAGLSSDDALALGNVFEDPDGLADSQEEIVVASGTCPDGTVKVYRFRQDPNRLEEAESFTSDFEPGDRIACGEFATMLDPDTWDEVAVVSGTDGYVEIFDAYPGSTGLTPWGALDTAFRTGDGFTTGNVLSWADDEIIVGDVDSDQVLIYRMNGMSRSFSQPLTPGDRLLAADIWGDSWDEILLFKRDDSPGWPGQHIYAFTCSVDADSVLTTRLVTSWPYSLSDMDRVAAGDLLPRLDKDEVLVGHGCRLDGHLAGEVDVLNGTGDSALDRDILDDLIDEGGEWAEKLAPGWAGNGYLLIVGETPVIPAFSRRYELYDTRDVGYTDNYYASTDDEVHHPDLAVGRIIGGNVNRLIEPIQASLDLLSGAAELTDESAAVISGLARGPGGTSDEIDFTVERNDVADLLDDLGFTAYELHEPTEDEFFDYVNNRDFIYLAGHGGSGGWDVIAWDMIDDHFDPGGKRPVVFGASCKTGSYYAGYSFAEAFLNGNAGAYIGATANATSPHCANLARRFYGELAPGVPVGESLKLAKDSLVDAGDSDSRGYNRYNAAIFHFYGDPKIEVDWTARKWSPEGRAPRPLDGSQLGGPVASLAVSVPMYAVTSSGGIDTVQIPGGGVFAEPGHAVVPNYTVWVDYAAGTQVRNVALAELGQPVTQAGLNLALAEVLEPGEEPGRTLDLAPAGDEWWPRRDFDWEVLPLPGGASRLILTIYPFFYNANTADAQFYQSYNFTIATGAGSVAARRLMAAKPVFGLGEPVSAELFLTESSGQLPDVLVEAFVSGGPEGGLEAGLPLRKLTGIKGLTSCAFDWDSAGAAAGDYQMEINFLNSAGALLGTASCPFSLGRSAGAITRLDADPYCFEEGQSVALKADFTNTGDRTVSGILYIEARKENQNVLAHFEAEFTGLAPGATANLPADWAPASAGRAYCQLVSWAEFDGNVSPARVEAVPVPGDLNQDWRVGADDLAILLAALAGHLQPGYGAFTACEFAGDLDGNGTLAAADAILLANLLAGNW